jgi:hypothetical protein
VVVAAADAVVVNFFPQAGFAVVVVCEGVEPLVDTQFVSLSANCSLIILPSPDILKQPSCYKISRFPLDICKKCKKKRGYENP